MEVTVPRSDGVVTLQAVCTDRAGNTQAAPPALAVVTLDFTPPVVALVLSLAPFTMSPVTQVCASVVDASPLDQVTLVAALSLPGAGAVTEVC